MEDKKCEGLRTKIRTCSLLSHLTAKKREEAKKTRRFYYELEWFKSTKILKAISKYYEESFH